MDSQMKGVSLRTTDGIEQRGIIPRTDIAQKLFRRWLQYSLWLMTYQVDEPSWQASPEIGKALKTLKQTGSDTD